MNSQSEVVEINRHDVEETLQEIFKVMEEMEQNRQHQENPAYDVLYKVSLMFDSALEGV